MSEEPSPTPINAVVDRMLADYGHTDLFELGHASEPGQVFFEVQAPTSSNTAQDMLATALQAVDVFFGRKLKPDSLTIASAHGSTRLHFRIVVRGQRMAAEDIRQRIIRLGLDHNPFDLSVYMPDAKLFMIGSKDPTQDDASFFRLIDTAHVEIPPTRSLLLGSIIQTATSDWPLMTEPSRDRKLAPTEDFPWDEEEQAVRKWLLAMDSRTPISALRWDINAIARSMRAHMQRGVPRLEALKDSFSTYGLIKQEDSTALVAMAAQAVKAAEAVHAQQFLYSLFGGEPVNFDIDA